MISFRIDWFDLLAVQGALKSLLQHHRSKVEFCQAPSIAQSGPTLCDPMDCSTPGFPVHHQLPELTGSFPMNQFFASGGQSISPSNEYSGLISFSMDLLDLLAVQGTLKSLLQHHSLKASILQHSAFFIAQLSHPYMTTGKTTALTRWTFVGKVMSLLFNMLSAAAAAKSLQLCLTLCYPRDSSPPGSPVPGILQAKTLEWVAISFSKA